HLLPIYDKPMIYYPISYLVDCGIEDIMVVTGGTSAGDFLHLLGNGRQFGLKDLHYTYQRGEGGIAEALLLARNFAGDEPVAVVLGDNIFENGIHQALDFYPGKGAMILLKEVSDPQRFGVPRLEGERVVEILEKPVDPPSPYAVVGAYVYDPRVFGIIDGLEPSARGELEITDVNNAYISWNEMHYGILDGWWTDAGTFDSLLQANRLVAESSVARVKTGPEDV
ncbi:MAG: spore coat protein, partial [Actinobacteria bacterium]